MSLITPNMSLTVWNSLTDKYDHSQLAANFVALDQHDHSPGRGAQINGSIGIKDYSIPGSKMASDFGISLPANSVPGTTIETASTGTGIGSAQLENSAVTYTKNAAIPYCELNTSATSIIAGSTETLFGFNTVTTDNMTTIDPSLSAMADTTNKRIYARVAGSYHYSMNFTVIATALTILSNPYLAAAIYKNESATSSPTSAALSRTVSTYTYSGATTGTWSVSLSGLVNLSVGDYLSVFYRNLISASAVPLSSTTTAPTFKLSWIGYTS